VKNIFVEKTKWKVLAVKETDVRFHFRGEYLKQISLSANKVIELRANGLLTQEKLSEYAYIALIHDKKQLKLPIIKNCWKYGGQNNALLKFSISPHYRLRKEDLKNWHLILFEKSNAKG
jgi:hypothetical protein